MNRMNWSMMILALLALASCHKGVFDSGPLITEERVLNDEYHKVTIESSMDVVVMDGASYDLLIEGGENKLPFIETKVVDGTLVLREKRNHIRNDKQVRIFISETYLNNITIDGSGDFTGDALTAGDLNINIEGSGDVDISAQVSSTIDVDINGSGDVKIDGNAEAVSIQIDGSGDVDTRLVNAQDAYVFVDGSGDVRLTATEMLHIEIDGSGDVYYWGNPASVELDIDGSGDVFDME